MGWLAGSASSRGNCAGAAGAAMEIADTDPSGRAAVFVCRFKLILVCLRKSAPRMHVEERFLITKAGNENDEPSGRRKRKVNLPSDCNGAPWTSVMFLSSEGALLGGGEMALKMAG